MPKIFFGGHTRICYGSVCDCLIRGFCFDYSEVLVRARKSGWVSYL
jgi:hypothetical protein